MKNLLSFGALSLISLMSYLNSVEIKSVKHHYKSNYNIATITTTDQPGNAKDWIGIYAVGDNNSWKNVIDWDWAHDESDSLYDFLNLDDGNYEARFFFNNTYKAEATVPFIVGNVVSIHASKETYAINESIDINVTKISGVKDWVGIYPKGANNSWNNVLKWSWAKKNGNLSITGLDTGEYEARLFFNNSYKVESKVKFKVSDVTQNPLKISKIKPMYISKNSVKIFWDANAYSTGQVEYGKTIEYGKFNKKETSFNYNHHGQLLRDLEAGITYHYRVIAEDRSGNKVISEDYTFTTLSNNQIVPYVPENLPTNIVQNEAMNMDLNHPNFNKWTKPEYIVNGHLELAGQLSSSYVLPRDIWLPHHKYTVVWDMETTGNINEDTFPIVRFSSLGYYSQGYQNTVLNKKETLYTVIVSKDDLVNNSYKAFSFSRRDTIPNSTMKISNIRIYDGVIELEKPVLKETNFQGTVAMDKEGVFRRNGKVIFPINIYKDNTLITRGVRTIDQYLNQGITGTIMEAHSEHWHGARDEKLSKMIEGGMTTMSVPITNYLKYPTYAVGTNYFNDFSTIMQTLKQDAQMWNGIAALSIDNEFYHKNQQFRDAITEIRNIIPDKPIQMLNGTEAISAWYNDYIDITGTYIASDIEVKVDHPEGTTNIHLMESQRLSPNLHVPVSLLQMNQGTSENFGSILMAGVALGGTKLEYWKDDDELFNGFRNLSMPTLPMWNQLPILRTYLDKMCDLGIIETTPYIGFKVEQTHDKYEYIKARLGHDDKAYIIASNMTSMANESTVQFNQTYKGLHYVPSGQLKDIMTGEVKGTINLLSKEVKITLAPHTWVVLEVEKK